MQLMHFPLHTDRLTPRHRSGTLWNRPSGPGTALSASTVPKRLRRVSLQIATAARSILRAPQAQDLTITPNATTAPRPVVPGRLSPTTSRRHRMYIKAAICLGWMGLLVAAMPAVAHADERISTSGCPDRVPVWRVEYRTFYSTVGEKARFLPSLVPALRTEATAFAQDVGKFTECAIRVQIDLVTHLPAYTPDRASEVHEGYDSYVTMVPEDDDHRPYVYDTRISPGWLIYTRTRVPTHQELMSFWLFELADFYRTALDLPDCVPWNCSENDLGGILTGKYVDSQGRQRGIPRETWVYQGTPRDPRHQGLYVTVKADTGMRRGIRVWWFPDGYRGPLDVSYFSTKGNLLYKHSLVARPDGNEVVYLRAPLAVGYGLIRVCVRTRMVARFESGEGCSTGRFRPSSGDLLSARRTSRSRLMMHATGPLLGRRMTYRVYSFRDLILGRRIRRRTIRLRRTQVLRIPSHRPIIDMRIGAFVWHGRHFPRFSWSTDVSSRMNFG